MNEEYSERKHDLYVELRGNILGTSDDMEACLSPDRKNRSHHGGQGGGLSPPMTPSRRESKMSYANDNRNSNSKTPKESSVVLSTDGKQTSHRTPPTSPNKVLNNSATKHPSNATPNSSNNFTDPKYEEQLRLERDKRIQLEIKQLHVETIKLERQGKEQYTQERKNIIHHKEIEETQLKNHIKQLNQAITNIIIEKEEIMKFLNNVTYDSKQLEQQIRDLKTEIQTYENGISINQIRIKEKNSILNYKLQDNNQQIQKQLKDIQLLIDQSKQSYEYKYKEQENMLQEIQYQHDLELENIEKGVCCA